MERAQAGAVRLPRADAEAPQGLELRHLRYFVAVADAGSFTLAAERMFIAQPTLSQQIRRLEQIVGAPLLQRCREGVRLTAAGTVLLDASRDVLSVVDHGVSRTRQAAGLGRERLRVVMPPDLPEALAVETASALRSAAAAADVDVVWLERPLDAEFSLIRQRQADAGLGWLTVGLDALPAPLDAMSVGEFEPGAWIPASHPAARRGSISLGQLADLEVIYGPRRAQPGTYDAWRRVLRAVEPRFEFTDPPLRHLLPVVLAFAATADRPAAVLTGPAATVGIPPSVIRLPGPAETPDMVRVSIAGHPLTATAAFVWSGDLSRPLQQILFDALLRAYRIGSARFQDWCLQELGRRTDNASIISAAGLRIAAVTASYIDKVSEEVLSAYESEKENWLRNQSAARAARVRALLRNEPVDVDSSEAILGYRLRQRHLGVVTWMPGAAAGGDSIGRLERATMEMAAGAHCDGRPMFVPQDEFSAWAWLPLGVRRDVAIPALSVRSVPGSDRIRFALGEPALGVTGFRRTHHQALNAQAVALAAGPAGQPVTSFGEVAPLALMSGSIELLQAWVIETLGALAADDEHNARLRDTLRVFLQENGSYKTTAEHLMLHKNTVQYRIRKAEERLGRPVSEDRLYIELALLASQWLGASVLRPADEPATRSTRSGTRESE